MARIVAGIGSSHAPQLATPPQDWGQRAGADKRNKALIYQGEDYAYEDLNALRGSAFADQVTLEVSQERYTRARAAIAELGRFLRAAEVDVMVIVSSDHKETFNDELLAPFVVYWGDEVQHEPYTQEQLDAMAPGLAVAEVANVPEVSTIRKTHSALGLHLIRQVQAAGFDPGASQQLPAGKYHDHAIPHGWGYVVQQVLGGVDIPPFVPVFVNTFWEPNPPSARRCYEFGRALGAAIESFPDDLRVAVVASGGLSHFVIDEELDRDLLDALQTKDAERLSGYSNEVLRAGTSEIRNWIVTAGALAAADLQAEVVDYVPAYRSEAGTGCGLGFVEWGPQR